MLDEVLEKIKEFDNIIIHRHKRPDGDCIGAQFGLKYFIEDNFPQKKVFAVGDEIPDYLKFVGQNDEASDDIYKDALVIVVDTSVKSRICDERYQNGKYIIKIDHHDDSEAFGDFEYVDAKSPALCQIVTLMLDSWHLPISKECALALYTGLTTDTGRFQFRGVGSNTFKAASILIDSGIDIEYIYTSISLKELNSFRLQAYLYQHMTISENGVCYIYFSKKIQKKFKISPEDASSLISSMSTIKNCLCWVTFTEYDTEIRVRLRSRFVSINQIGKKYHGGGHLQAAGATIYHKKEIKNVIDDLDKLVKEYKLSNPEVK